MIDELISKQREYFPLAIEEICWDGTTLILRGSTWNFHTMNPWRIVNKTNFICGYREDSALDTLNQLQSEVITTIFSQSRVLPIDLVFEFSGGSFLEIFTIEDWEPWVFYTPSGHIFVA